MAPADGSIVIPEARVGAGRQAVAGDTLYRPGQDVTLQLTIVNDVSRRAAKPRVADAIYGAR